MTTFGQVVQQVMNSLHSFTTHDAITWLAAAVVDTTGTSITVSDAWRVSEGVIEVDEELMYVASSNTSTGVCTIAPFGRGYAGSTAATHLINAKVTFDPSFPKLEVKRAINQVLQDTYPKLFARKTTTITFAGSKATYELPADCDRVLKVTYEASGPSLNWPLVRRFSFDPDSELASGKAITFLQAPEQGSAVKIVYAAPFTAFTLDADTMATVGFPESAVDVLVYGACHKLVQFLDVARLQLHSAENKSRAEVVSAGDATRVSNQFYAMYSQRLDEERKKLLELYPPQMQYEGW